MKGEHKKFNLEDGFIQVAIASWIFDTFSEKAKQNIELDGFEIEISIYFGNFHDKTQGGERPVWEIKEMGIINCPQSGQRGLLEDSELKQSELDWSPDFFPIGCNEEFSSSNFFRRVYSFGRKLGLNNP